MQKHSPKNVALITNAKINLDNIGTYYVSLLLSEYERWISLCVCVCVCVFPKSAGWSLVCRYQNDILSSLRAIKLVC